LGVDEISNKTIIIFPLESQIEFLRSLAIKNEFSIHTIYWYRPNESLHSTHSYVQTIVPILVFTLADKLNFSTAKGSASNTIFCPSITTFSTNEERTKLCATEKPWFLYWQLIYPFWSPELRVIN
jgi:hypothetical protein